MIYNVFLIFTLSLEASHLRAAQTEVLFQLGTDTAGHQLMRFSHFLKEVAVVGAGEVLQLRAQASPPCHSTLVVDFLPSCITLSHLQNNQEQMVTFELENAHLAGCWTTVMSQRKAQGKGLSFTQNQSNKKTLQAYNDFCFWWGRLPLCQYETRQFPGKPHLKPFEASPAPQCQPQHCPALFPHPTVPLNTQYKPVLNQFICFQSGHSKTQEEKPALQNSLMEIQRCVFQSSPKDSTVLKGNQECSQETSRYTSRELFLLLNGQLKPPLFCHISMSLQSQ